MDVTSLRLRHPRILESDKVTNEEKHEWLVASVLYDMTPRIFDDFFWMREVFQIKGVSRSALKLDAKGIDIIIVYQGKGLPLQVKVTKEEANLFKKKCPDIPIIWTEQQSLQSILGQNVRYGIAKKLQEILRTSTELWSKECYDHYTNLVNRLHQVEAAEVIL